MSYRERSRVSGYRSQPVSNRTSMYLTSDLNSNVTDDLTDFDRQFKKLLERTENFTNRVERLQNTSTYLKKGYRRTDNAGIRGHRDYSYGNVLSDLGGYEETTEEEWKRLLDAGKLIERAVELVRQRYRYPKPLYEYSPDSPSPRPYEVPPGTVLIPNPKSPRDKYGRRIPDPGSDIRFINEDKNGSVGNSTSKIRSSKRDDVDKCLTSLKEIDENWEIGRSSISKTSTQSANLLDKSDTNNGDTHIESSNSIGRHNQKSTHEPYLAGSSRHRTHDEYQPTVSNFHSESIFGEAKIEKHNGMKSNSDREGEKTPKESKKSSLLRTLKNATSRSRRRPPTMYDEATIIQSEESMQSSKLLLDPYDSDCLEKMKRKSPERLIYTNAELIRMAHVERENEKAEKSAKSEERKTSSPLNKASKKLQNSSSFHEYNPSNRIPLKERLKQKMDEAEDEDRSYRNTNDKSQKEETSSFTSRFLRRFRSGSEDKTNDCKEVNEIKDRKKSDEPRENSFLFSTNYKRDKDRFKPDDNNILDDSRYDGYSSRSKKYHRAYMKKDFLSDKETERRKSRESRDDSIPTSPLKYRRDSERSNHDSSYENAGSSILEKTSQKTHSVSSYSRMKDSEISDSTILTRRSAYITKKDAELSDSTISTRRSAYMAKKDTELSDSCNSKRRSAYTTRKDAELSDSSNSKRRSAYTTKKDAELSDSSNSKRRSAYAKRRDSETSPKSVKRSSHALRRDSEYSDNPAEYRSKSRQSDKEEERKSSIYGRKIVRKASDESSLVKSPPREVGSSNSLDENDVRKSINLTKIRVSDKESDCEERMSMQDVNRRSLYVWEELIEPVVKEESVVIDFKSPRNSGSSEVFERIPDATIQMDKPLEDSLFDPLLIRKVSEEILRPAGIYRKISIDDELFEKIYQIPSHSSSSCEENESEDLHLGEDAFSINEKSEIITEEQKGHLDITDRQGEASDLVPNLVETKEVLGNAENTLDVAEVEENIRELQEVQSELNEENKNNGEQNISLLHQLLDDIEKANDEMYDDLLCLTKRRSHHIEEADDQIDKYMNCNSHPYQEEFQVAIPVEVDEHESDFKCSKPAVLNELAENDKALIEDDEKLMDVDVIEMVTSSPSCQHFQGKTVQIDINVDCSEGSSNIDNDIVTNGLEEATPLLIVEGRNSDIFDDTAGSVNTSVTNSYNIDISIESLTCNENGDRSENPSRERLSYIQKRESHMNLFENKLTFSSENIPMTRVAEIAMEDICDAPCGDGTDVKEAINDRDEDIGNDVTLVSYSQETTLIYESESEASKNISEEEIDSSKEDSNGEKLKGGEGGKIDGNNTFESTPCDNEADECELSSSTVACNDLEIGEIGDRRFGENIIIPLEGEVPSTKNVTEYLFAPDEGKQSGGEEQKSADGYQSVDQWESKSVDEHREQHNIESGVRRSKSLDVDLLNEMRDKLEDLNIDPNLPKLSNDEKKSNVEKKSLDAIKRRISEIRNRRSKLIAKSFDFQNKSDPENEVVDIDSENVEVIRTEQTGIPIYDETSIALENIPHDDLRSDGSVSRTEESDPAKCMDENDLEMEEKLNDDVKVDEIDTPDVSERISDKGENGSLDKSAKSLSTKIVTSVTDTKDLSGGVVEIRTINEKDSLLRKENEEEERCSERIEEIVADVQEEKAYSPLNVKEGSSNVEGESCHSNEHSNVDKPLTNDNIHLVKDAISPPSDDEHKCTSPALSERSAKSNSDGSSKLALSNASCTDYQREMSIVEYRRRKLEKEASGTSTSYYSDEESFFFKTDNDKEGKSSVDGISDTSVDYSHRKKRYSRSKKDMKIFDDQSSTSESELLDVEPYTSRSIVDLLANRYSSQTRSETEKEKTDAVLSDGSMHQPSFTQMRNHRCEVPPETNI